MQLRSFLFERIYELTYLHYKGITPGGFSRYDVYQEREKNFKFFLSIMNMVYMKNKDIYVRCQNIISEKRSNPCADATGAHIFLHSCLTWILFGPNATWNIVPVNYSKLISVLAHREPNQKGKKKKKMQCKPFILPNLI